MMMGDPVRFYPRALKNLAVVQEIGKIHDFKKLI